MYRAVALWALRANIDLDDLHRLEQLAREARIEYRGDADIVLLNGEDVTAAIREDPASPTLPQMYPSHRGFAGPFARSSAALAPASSVVMEGRDIGTVIFPDARVKIYLDADPEVRAGRRAKETGEVPRSTSVCARSGGARPPRPVSYGGSADAGAGCRVFGYHRISAGSRSRGSHPQDHPSEDLRISLIEPSQ